MAASTAATRAATLSEGFISLAVARWQAGRVRKEVLVVASPDNGSARLVLSESPEETGQAATWIGPLLALGARAGRYARNTNDRQLVIVVSVPKRDFAAALIGCGWVLVSEPPDLRSPLDTLRRMAPGQAMRAVNSREVITAAFGYLDETANPPRAHFAGSGWRVDAIRALAPISEFEQPERAPRPNPGSIEHMARLDISWDSRLVLPAADLAIVGTLKWLKEDFEAYLSKEGDGLSPSSIGTVLMPRVGRAATWFTRLYASATLADNLPLPEGVNAVILDGNGAIQRLAEIEASVVICVLDRSVADEAAAEMVVQLRNTRGEPISLAKELGWQPPTGVEALGFAVPL